MVEKPIGITNPVIHNVMDCQGGEMDERLPSRRMARCDNPAMAIRASSSRVAYSAASRTWREVGVRMVTSSSADVGCNATVVSKSSLVAFILIATAAI